MDRRAFLEILSLVGLSTGVTAGGLASLGHQLYELPTRPANTLTLFHITDTHAQLNPVWFREISEENQANDIDQYVYSQAHFEELARQLGRVGGFSHLKTLVTRLKAARPEALLLDGGDTWQGSELARLTDARDMVEAQRILGVDLMTGHWEFTLGRSVVQKNLAALKGQTEFLAQNVFEEPFGDPVFTPWVMREQAGIPFAVVGQAFPFTPIAHPRRFTEGWTFGLHERSLQNHVNDARRQGAQAVILLSHNGLPVDLKLASRITGIDLILGGHTHDPLPKPLAVENAGGVTWVSNAGSHGKFLAVADLQIRPGGVDLSYRLLPVFSNLLPPDTEMAAWIEKVRAPHQSFLETPIARAPEFLFRRDRFEGSMDRLILNALIERTDAEISLSPGFRWGAARLAGEILRREDILDMTAVSYPEISVMELTGEAIKNRLEDIADNVFNPDPYYQEGGDMVRVAGLSFLCQPAASMGQRIESLHFKGEPLMPNRRYRVANWASMNEGPQWGSMGDCLSDYLKRYSPV